MLGVLYSAASDLSTFSSPRPLCLLSGVCLENHATAIEARYCPKQHVLQWSDVEWEQLLAKEQNALSEPDRDDLFTFGFPQTPLSTFAFASDSFPTSALSTPRLVLDDIPEEDDDDDDDECKTEPDLDADSDSDYEEPSPCILTTKLATNIPRPPVNSPSSSQIGDSIGKKRKRGKGSSKPTAPNKRFCRTPSTISVATISSAASVGSLINRSASSTPSNADIHLVSPSEAAPGTNPWKCPYCSWVQHTQRLPDFLRHQRSHFVQQSDWPCPNAKCGKGFARKDSLKRHLDNRATGCRRPPGYTVC